MGTLKPNDYPGASASAKLDFLWERVVAEAYTGELPTDAPGLESAKLLLVPYDRVTLERVSDELPEGRRKLTHALGSVARVRVRVLDPRGYTGLFATDSLALLRYSDAADLAGDPSGALKFTIDAQRSRNLLANLDGAPGEGNPHPLSLPLSSSTPEPTGVRAALAKAFDATSRAVEAGRWRGIYQPLLPLAAVTQGGEAIEAPQAPDRVEWHPTEAARAACPDKGDWRLGLAEIPEGTVLYQLRVASVPEAEAIPWAELVLESSFINSRYGDEVLFFQHQF